MINLKINLSPFSKRQYRERDMVHISPKNAALIHTCCIILAIISAYGSFGINHAFIWVAIALVALGRAFRILCQHHRLNIQPVI